MKTIICDLDGTLIDDRLWPIDHVINFINRNHGKYNIAIVTGKPISVYSQTIKRLKSLGVKYDRLYMSPAIGMDLAYKKEIARKLNRDGNVELAIDNDIHAREIYQNEGIVSYSPSNIDTAVLKFNWSHHFG